MAIGPPEGMDARPAVTHPTLNFPTVSRLSPSPIAFRKKINQSSRMDYFSILNQRRSVRLYTSKPVPSEVIDMALDAALLAPNSSNLQSWLFFKVKSADKKTELIEACLGQSAARTAQALVVFAVNRKTWQKHAHAVIEAQGGPKASPQSLQYYNKLIPVLYGYSFLNPLKFLLFNIIGLARPMMRRPVSTRDLDEVAIKSSALAAQNFMNAIVAQGFDCCPMEGFDEKRVRRLLGLPCSARITMVVSVGERDPKGIWGERFRVPKDWVIKEV
jgi:nitroreductase